MTEKREFIDRVVDEFYRVATVDILIGHQFRKIALKESSPGHPLRPPLEAFSHHLPRIKRFWYIQLLHVDLSKDMAAQQGLSKSDQDNYQRKLMQPFDLIQIHRALFIRMGELNRWLTLFEQTLKAQQDLTPASHKKEIEELSNSWRLKLDFFKEKFKKIL